MHARKNRLSTIESILEDKGRLSVKEIQDQFHISTATAYRDIRMLEDTNRGHCVNGGIVKYQLPRMLHADKPYYEKMGLNANEKERIAQTAAGMVCPGMSIFLDSSTTVFFMCKYLMNLQDVRIITNDIRIASALSDSPGLSIYVSGGMLRKNYYTLIAASSSSALDGITADIAFMSCDAVTAEHGCMITNGNEVAIKKQIIDISVDHVLLCDHTKFNKTAFMSFSSVMSFSKIIVGKELEESIVKKYRKKGLTLTIV